MRGGVTKITGKPSLKEQLSLKQMFTRVFNNMKKFIRYKSIATTKNSQDRMHFKKSLGKLQNVHCNYL